MTYLTITAVAQLALVGFLLLDRRTERREAAAERADLLQRIQAPQQAVYEHSVGTRPPLPEPLPFDDDEAFHASREDLVNALAGAEL